MIRPEDLHAPETSTTICVKCKKAIEPGTAYFIHGEAVHKTCLQSRAANLEATPQKNEENTLCTKCGKPIIGQQGCRPLGSARQIMILRPEVLKFAGIMEGKLKQNDYKGGWLGCDILELLFSLEEEVRELKRAIRDGGDLGEEAADVANYAMMIADKAGALTVGIDPYLERHDED